MSVNSSRFSDSSIGVDWAANDWLTSAARIEASRDVRLPNSERRRDQGQPRVDRSYSVAPARAWSNWPEPHSGLEIDKARLGMEQVTKDSSWAREQWYARSTRSRRPRRGDYSTSVARRRRHARMAQDEQALYINVARGQEDPDRAQPADCDVHSVDARGCVPHRIRIQGRWPGGTAARGQHDHAIGRGRPRTQGRRHGTGARPSSRGADRRPHSPGPAHLRSPSTDPAGDSRL
jgi:hypothetical protein